MIKRSFVDEIAGDMAGKRISDSGILLFAALISGIGGKDYWAEHAKESAIVYLEVTMP